MRARRAPAVRVIALAYLVTTLLSTIVSGPALAADAAIPRKLDVIEVVRQRDFVALDRIFEAATEAGTWGQYSDIFYYGDPTIEADLTAWVQARPESVVPLLARATYYQHVAYLNRGAKWSRLTHARQFAGMTRFFRLASADAERVTALDPGRGSAYAILLGIAAAQGDGESANRLRREGLAHAPAHARIHSAYLRLLQPRWSGTWQEMYTYVEALREQFKDNPDLRFLNGYAESHLATQLWEQGEEASAIHYVISAIAKHDTADRRALRARIHHDTKDYDKALEQINLAIAMAPDEPEYYFIRSYVHFVQERPEDGISDMNMGVELDPYIPRNLLKRVAKLQQFANAQQNSGKREQRAETLRQIEADLTNALVHGEFDADVHSAWGTYHDRLDGDRDTAFMHYETAISLQPAQPHYWSPLINSLLARKDCRVVDAVAMYLKVCNATQDCEPNRSFSHYIQLNMPACRVATLPDGRPLPLPPNTEELVGSLELCKALFGKESDESAIKACHERAEAGDAAAQYDLGRLYASTGIRLAVQGAHEEHLALAAEWLKKASAQGHAEAKGALGQMYIDGFGIPRDTETGLRLLLDAADAGSVKSLTELGRRYFSGVGLPVDKEKARAFYRRARALGSEEAAEAISRLFGDHG